MGKQINEFPVLDSNGITVNLFNWIKLGIEGFKANIIINRNTTKKVIFSCKMLKVGEQLKYCVFVREQDHSKSSDEALKIEEICSFPVFRQFPTGIALVGIDGKCTKVNSALCEILGYSEAELLEMNFQSLTHPDDLDSDLRQFNEIMNNSIRSYQIEKRYIRKEGTPIWTRVSTFMVRNHENMPLYCILQIENIDENKKAAFALKESQERFFLDMNKRTCEILGYSRDELLKMELIDCGKKKAIPTVALDMTKCKQAEKALRDYARQLEHSNKLKEEMEQIINNSPVIVFLWKYEDGWPIEFVSENVTRFGYEVEDLISTSKKVFYSDIVYPEDLEKVGTDIARNVEAGCDVFTSEYRILTRSGDIRWVDERTFIQRDEKGEIHLQGIILDITERKQAEKALEEKVQFLKTLLDTIPAPVFYKGRDEKYQGCNELFSSNVVGLPKESIIGHTIYELPGSFSKKVATLHRESDLKLLRSGGADFYESKVACKNGEERNFFFSKAAYRDVLGEVVGVIGVMLDIEELKQAEENLQIKNTAIESSISAIAFSDLNENLTYLNPSFLKLWDYEDQKELLGKNSKCLWEKQEKNIEIFRKTFFEERWEGDLIARKKDDSLFNVHLSANLLRDKNGRKIGIMESFVDITQRKKTEAALKEAKLNAEAASRAKSEFLATVSHELRTPLNAVIGFSDLLLSQVFGPLNKKQLRHVSNISVSGKHLLRLINDILDLSKVEAGMTELNLEDLSLQEIIEEIKIMMLPHTAPKNIRIIYQISPNTPHLKADKTKFKQILYNLVGNALKFSPEKSTINISSMVSGDRVLISVEDHGQGIPEEKQQNIFRPFVQLEKFESREQGGAGLGLSLVKRFVEMQGGEVWVESEVGRGSIFTFTIPIIGEVDAYIP